MTLGEQFQVPPETKGTLIVPPNIQTVMSGVVMALVEPSNRVSLLYTDGSIERAVLEPTAEPREFFALVSAVQGSRKEVVAAPMAESEAGR